MEDSKPSKIPTVYLINSKDFDKFAVLKHKVEQLQSELKSFKDNRFLNKTHLKQEENKSPPIEQPKIDSQSEADEPDQIGAGSANQPDYQKEFFNLFASFMEKRYAQTDLATVASEDQHGTGSNSDLTPQVAKVPELSRQSTDLTPQVAPIVSDIKLEPPATVNQSDTEPAHLTAYNLDEKKLIASVPSKQRLVAKKLLKKLDEHSDVLNISSDGAITVDGQNLEGNFYELFPMLYRPVKHHYEKAALNNFINELATLGLSPYFLRHYSVGWTPRHHKLEKRSEFRQKIKGLKNWYFLG